MSKKEVFKRIDTLSSVTKNEINELRDAFERDKIIRQNNRRWALWICRSIIIVWPLADIILSKLVGSTWISTNIHYGIGSVQGTVMILAFLILVWLWKTEEK